MSFERILARWHAAMRGKVPTEYGPNLTRLLAEVPHDAERAVLIYPTGIKGEYACQWVGLTASQAASALYQMADKVVDQKVAPDPRWSRR